MRVYTYVLFVRPREPITATGSEGREGSGRFRLSRRRIACVIIIIITQKPDWFQS